MVHLKASRGKDVLIFKHLEQPVLHGFRSAAPITYRNLKEKAVLGLYFGGYSSCTFFDQDFILAEKGLIANQQDVDGIPRCQLNGYNFIPNYVFDLEVNDRLVDVIGIFNANAFKRHADFVQLGNRLNDQHQKRVRLITYGKLKDIERLNRSLSQLNPSFPILYGVVNAGTFPFDHQFVIDSLLQAKVLLHTSTREGAARIVSEALSCGLGVVTRRDLKGGTNVRLDDYPAARFFSDLAEAERGVLEILAGYPNNIDRKFAHANFNEERSVEYLTTFLENEFGSSVDLQPYHNRVSALIPSHLNVLDQRYSNPNDDGVNKSSQLIDFCEKEFGIAVPGAEKARAQIIDKRLTLTHRAKRLYKNLKAK